MNQDKIGKFILECRKKKGLTQEALAEKLGVTDKSVSNWENGRNMPDLSLFKPLCEVLDISINDLISGEIVSKEKYQDRLEENIIRTIDYSNKKIIKKNNLINIILTIFGIALIVTAMSIFPSESSWGSIYSIIGIIISLIGVAGFIKNLTYILKVLFSIGYLIFAITGLVIIDYISVVNIKQAPRFSLYKISARKTIYYDTPFYDVVRCNKDTKDEYYKIMKNQSYDSENIEMYCK